MRPIIHIGYHKTATTWFQDDLYPAAVSHQAMSRRAIKDALIAPPALAFDPAAARAALTPEDGRPPVLCEEGLSGYIHNGGLAGFMAKGIADRLHAAFPDARIVIAIRNQPSMIAAVYQQYVRGGGTYGPRRYLFPDRHNRGAFAEAYKVPRFALAHFDYDRLIAYYDGLFGRENVHVLPYESLSRDRAGTLAALARATGLRVDPAGVSAGRRNASYALAIVFLARLLNHFTRRTVLDKRTLIHIPGWYRIRRVLIEALNRTGWFGPAPAPETLLGRSVVAHLCRRFMESNRRLAALRPDLPLADYGYPLAQAGRQPRMSLPAALLGLLRPRITPPLR